MLKRLIRWIARREIAEACAPIVMEHAMASALHGMQLTTEYLKGYQRGIEDAYATIEKQVRERVGGASDVVTPEDVARAKKGIVH